MTAPLCLASQPPNHPPRHCAGDELDGALPLCRPCLDHAGTAVPLLAHDWRDLEQLLPKPISVWSDGQPRGGGEAPIPLQLSVEALQAEIWWLSTAWAEVLADAHRLAPAPHRRPSPPKLYWAVAADGTTSAWARPSRVEHPSARSRPMRPGPADIVRAVRVLGPRVAALARVGPVDFASYPGVAGLVEVAGAQGLLDLGRAHARARTMLGLTEPVYALPGRCQSRGCGAAELRVRDGSDSVWCDRCGVAMTRDDYDRLGNVFLREAAA